MNEREREVGQESVNDRKRMGIIVKERVRE